MKSKERDRLAAGPDPRARVAPPAAGERCPRCHGRAGGGWPRPCLLCAPHLVPVAFGGSFVGVPGPQAPATLEPAP